MLDIAHCLRYVYMLCFGSWFDSHLQEIGCHYTQWLKVKLPPWLTKYPAIESYHVLNYTHDVKTPWRCMVEWRYGSTFLNLSATWKWAVCFKPQPLYPWRRKPWYPFHRKLDGSQSWSRCSVREKNSLPLAGYKPPRPACMSVLILTELPKFLAHRYFFLFWILVATVGIDPETFWILITTLVV